MLKTVGVWKCETWPLSIILDCCYSYILFFLFPDQGCHVVWPHLPLLLPIAKWLNKLNRNLLTFFCEGEWLMAFGCFCLEVFFHCPNHVYIENEFLSKSICVSSSKRSHWSWFSFLISIAIGFWLQVWTMPRKNWGKTSSHLCAAFQTQELGDFVPRRSTGGVKNLAKIKWCRISEPSAVWCIYSLHH